LTHSTMYHRAGEKTGKTFGIPCQSVSKIAKADSTSVFSGFFPTLLEHAMRVKFRSLKGGPATTDNPPVAGSKMLGRF
jgi:hypothetical protein